MIMLSAPWDLGVQLTLFLKRDNSGIAASARQYITQTRLYPPAPTSCTSRWATPGPAWSRTAIAHQHLVARWGNGWEVPKAPPKLFLT